MPAITSRSTPVKTRNRLRAHHSMVRLITLHSSRRIEREVLAHDDLSVLSGGDRYLPRAARSELAAAFVHATSLVSRVYHGFHGSHPHLLHCRHEECDRYLGAVHWHSVTRSKPHVNLVAAFVWWRRIGRQFDCRLRLCWCIHGCRCTGTRRRRCKCPSSCLQLRFGVD